MSERVYFLSYLEWIGTYLDGRNFERCDTIEAVTDNDARAQARMKLKGRKTSWHRLRCKTERTVPFLNT